MGKMALLVMVVVALSAVVNYGQGQPDQATGSATDPLPPNEVWYTYDSWIEQYADSLREYYGSDNCDFFKDSEYILFILENNDASSVNLALFDINKESFISHRGIACDLYYRLYLNKNKGAIYNSIKPKISSIEANSQVIKDFTNEGVKVYDNIYLPNPTKFGYYVSNIAAWAKAYVSCKDIFEPENIGLGCAASINSLALESKLSDAKGLETYDQILKAVEERKSEWPEFLDEAEKAVQDSMTSEEAQLKTMELIKYSTAYVEFDPLKESLTSPLSNLLSDASAKKITKISGRLILGKMIEPGDYKMATQFGTLANWHAMVADEYAERARDDLELFSINPSIENYHQVVRDCVNGYENIAVGYLLLSVIIQSQADTKTGWAGAAISDSLNTIKDVVHYLGLDSFIGINLGPTPKVGDLIETYQALATKNLEWKVEALNMDGVFTLDLLKQIPENLLVPVAPITEEVIFPDPNLEAAVRAAIDKPEGAIYAADLEGLTELDTNGKNIEDIIGLEYCNNLQFLNMYNNQITDLSPLKDLTNLQALILLDNQITDLSPLKGLTNLQDLYLVCNQIIYLAPLNNLLELRGLQLSDNQITDLSPLKGLTNLKCLYLNNNQITDLSPLKDLINLEELALDNNQVIDLSPLKDLKNLQYLYLHNNQITDISPLKDLKNLKALNLSRNQITDVSPLSGLACKVII